MELSQEEIQVAQQLQQQIDSVASEISSGEQTISSRWVKLGSLVYQVRQKKYWSAYGHHSFGSYVVTLEPKIRRKRSQIYLCVGVIETLGSQVSEEDLETMGISKANELKKYVKESGKIIPSELLQLALSSEIDLDNLKASVADALHKTPDEKGSWLDLGGFYVSDDERRLILDTIELAKNIDPVVPHDIPEHAQKKEAVLRLVMEFQSTYGGQE